MGNISLEELEKYEIITLVISKEWIDTRFFIEIDEVFKTFLFNPVKFENKIIILIEGYDNDKRPIWDISEIREYFKILDLLFPYWFYFLKKEEKSDKFGIKMLMFLLVPIKIIGNNGNVATTEFDIPAYEKFMMYHFHYLNELTDKLKYPLEENKRITKLIMNCFE